MDSILNPPPDTRVLEKLARKEEETMISLIYYRYQRELKNLSQEELAFRISSTRNYIGCIERGEKFPSIAIILDIKHALGCKSSDLFDNI